MRAETERMMQLMREAAAKEILPRYGKVVGEQKGVLKGFKDVVTEADYKASEYILNRIRPDFPGSYSEEHLLEDRFDHELIWQIDPVDGTDEFCSALLDGFASHAALLKRVNEKYVPVAGIIYQVGIDEMWAYDGERVRYLVNGVERTFPEQRRDLCGWVRQVDPSESLINFYISLGRKLGVDTSVSFGGGSGAGFADLLSGKTSLFIFNWNYSKEWDVAMMVPIVRAMGGFICDCQGNDFTFNQRFNPESSVKKEREPYLLQGYVASVVFKKDEILPHIPKGFVVDRL